MDVVLVTLLIWFLFAGCSQCFEKRSFSQSLQDGAPWFDSYANQICGYITADINNALACYDGQYCTTMAGFFGCCNGISSTYDPYVITSTWTATLTPTAEDTTTSTWTYSASAISYSYNSCNAYTTCYASYDASISCTGDCASNTDNLLCTNTYFPYCQTLTMAHKDPNTTYTAFWCAEIDRPSVLPLYVLADTTPIRTDQTAATTTSYSPTASTPTSVTQTSNPASAAGTLTVASTSMNRANLRASPHIIWTLIPLILMLDI